MYLHNFFDDDEKVIYLMREKKPAVQRIALL